jgi:endonuclease/exonuclease/phosphatase family metal-dependent hydrolase
MKQTHDIRTSELRVAGWNIHRGRGQDRVVDPERTLRVLCDEVCAQCPDILVLEEADEEARPHRGILDMARLEQETGLRSVHTLPVRRWSGESHGFLGVIVLMAPDFEVEEVTLLDLPGQCHRGAVIVDARRGGVALRLVGTHLSLSQPLRIVQMRTLGQHLARRQSRPLIVCGDLNEWRPWGGMAFSHTVLGLSLHGPAVRTFPVGWPVLPLDRILAGEGARVADARALDGPGIRIASDHRPLLGQVVIGG